MLPSSAPSKMAVPITSNVRLRVVWLSGQETFLISDTVSRKLARRRPNGFGCADPPRCAAGRRVVSRAGCSEDEVRSVVLIAIGPSLLSDPARDRYARHSIV